MNFKDIFNQESNGDKDRMMSYFKQQDKRIIELETQINHLTRLEEKVRPLLAITGHLEKIIKNVQLDNEKKLKTKGGITAYFNHREIYPSSAEPIGFEATIPIESSERASSPAPSNLEERIFLLEKNIALLNELQRDIIKRLGSLSHLPKSKTGETGSVPFDAGDVMDKAVVVQELHIEQVIVDRYEQNNNFAQMGIKELSGVLNIGATYGALPGTGKVNTNKAQDPAGETEKRGSK
ncbi:hypothetical protein [Peribacillus sp. SCS-155]|uniref:hypothetical protein n=1 Tax=Peribacillus sedimenti TaxID=3115297 RepID=UPI003905BFBD